MPGTKRANSRAVRRPKLGQNFLADVGAAEKIVDALGDVSESVVMEIGPGKGALTQVRARLCPDRFPRSEEHTSELQSRQYLVCRLLLEKKKKNNEQSHQ